jgi:hypothetical protein
MSRLLRGRLTVTLPAALVMPFALLAAPSRAADDFVQEDTPPVAAPQPRVLLMPPLRLEMRQLQQQAAEAPPVETRKASYLGVATRPLAPELRARVLQIYPGGRSQSVTVMSDGDGSVEIRDTDGERTVTIKDPAGREIYSGSLAGDADREQVPETFRDKVRSAEERLGGRRQPRQKPPAKKPAAPAEADDI